MFPVKSPWRNKPKTVDSFEFFIVVSVGLRTSLLVHRDRSSGWRTRCNKSEMEKAGEFCQPTFEDVRDGTCERLAIKT
jgi:hypothetical protein